MSLFVQDGRRAVDLFDRGGNFGGTTQATATGDFQSGTLDQSASGGNSIRWDDSLGACLVYGRTALTNAVSWTLQLNHNSTGTTAAGFGVGILFGLENAGAGLHNTGDISFIYTDPTAGSECTDFRVRVDQAGAQTEAMRLRGADLGMTVAGSIESGDGAIGLTGANMALGGDLTTLSLPATDNGSLLVARAATLTTFQARRGTAGASGTTTIELEVNGTPTGDTLSWTEGTDPNNELKTAVISQAVAVGDRISFRVTAVGTGTVEDIYAEVH